LLKQLSLYLLFSGLCFTANAQYYLRGVITDENNQPLDNVRITTLSDHMTYYTDNYGSFGMAVNGLEDSLSLDLNGYDLKIVHINTSQFQSITLKRSPATARANTSNHALVSITGDMDAASRLTIYDGNESYFTMAENKPVLTKDHTDASFALNIDKASYSNVRRFLTSETAVPPDAVRTEELLNYFDLHYKQPAKNNLFEMQSQLTDCPWSANKLLYLNVNAQKIDLGSIPPSNLVFLIDASGSMDMPDKLPIIKAAFRMLVKNLRPIDSVSMIVFGGNVTLWLRSTSGADGKKIIQAIEKINADGETPGEAAIQLAYATADSAYIPGGNNRVILATDGDFNVGKVHEEELEKLIEREKLSGVYLTCLGVGSGNLKDSNLEALATKGKGNYAYLDNINEAQRVLVEEMTKNLYAVADNVSLNVSFNPNVIRSYRLIGFDNPKAAMADTGSVLEGGEIGSGNGLTAIFEITPVTPGIIDSCISEEGDVAKVTLTYTLPDQKNVHSVDYFCGDNYIHLDSTDREYRFGAALVWFAQKLRNSLYIGKTGMNSAEQIVYWNNIEKLAANSYDPDDYLQGEFVNLIELAKKVYTVKKKKKKKSDDD
jgi:Ca-activated chloride channel family protein